MKHASIVPLIGGEVIGASKVFGLPKYLMSYEPFWNNDQHIVKYYEGQVPYHVLDKGERLKDKVDVISSVCPCAGLSTLSAGFGDHNPNNQWLLTSAKYVLSEVRPEVYWGENSPHLAGKIGKNILAEMRRIGVENNYKLSVFRTKNLLHGSPQVRERCFYFFWRGSKIPIFSFYDKPRYRIEDCISSVSHVNSLQETINKKIPSIDDPYYRYVLEKMHGGISHKEFVEQIPEEKARGVCILAYTERAGHDYLQVKEWMAEHGYEKEAKKCQTRADKLAAGGSIMRRGTIIPKDYIGAFVGHYPIALTHPTEDRYITHRESLAIMGMPEDFMLIDPDKNFNHVCQNVPVQTAEDMAREIKEALEGNRDWIEADYVLQNNKSRTIVEDKPKATLSIFE